MVFHSDTDFNELSQIEKNKKPRHRRGFFMVRTDLEWKKKFITKAITYKRDVVPVHFTGGNSKFFYRIYQLLKLLGIKANIEMFYLVVETFRHRGEHITITFGIPIAYIAFGNSRTPVQLAKWVKQQVRLLVGIADVPL